MQTKKLQVLDSSNHSDGNASTDTTFRLKLKMYTVREKKKLVIALQLK